MKQIGKIIRIYLYIVFFLLCSIDIKSMIIVVSAKTGREKDRVRHKKTKVESDNFSLFETSIKDLVKVKHAICQQACIALSKGLQVVGVDAKNADTITSNLVDLVRKGYEISNHLNQEISELTKRKQGIEKANNKIGQSSQELINLQKQIDALQEKKKNDENAIGIIASGLSVSISQLGVGSQTQDAVKNLLKELQVPGAQYGDIAASIVAELWKGINKFKENSYKVSLRPNMVYYAATVTQYGGWIFGQHLPSGKVYVRLDIPCENCGGKNIEHCELRLKNVYPYKSIEELMVQIMAGEFTLGKIQSEHLA